MLRDGIPAPKKSTLYLYLGITLPLSRRGCKLRFSCHIDATSLTLTLKLKPNSIPQL